MSQTVDAHLQRLIAHELRVEPGFDPEIEIERRIEFLAERLRKAGAAGFVLGISGGVDSSVAGRLCQMAVQRARGSGQRARFVGMRLPYGEQFDEADAQAALEFVAPDEVLTVDVAPAADAMLDALRETAARPENQDFVHGNIKARQRMIAQYAVAGDRGLLVAGTDHASEAVMGFFTKHGDGACDLTPLTGLTKRRVRALAAALGASDTLVRKLPTADLESGRPGHPDEDAFGITYDDIDDFLEGKPVSAEVAETVARWHARTAHKRALPNTP